MSDFPPIADYAFLSDCEDSCLIAPDGSVEWLCLPRPDSPSVFGALLDRSAGSFRFGPSNTMVPHHRRYVPGTMVVETTWHTPTGWLVVQDLMVIRKVEGGTRRPGYRRAPSDSAAAGVLLRTATVHRRQGRGRGQLRAPVRLRRRHRPVGLQRRRLRLPQRPSRRTAG